MIKSVRCIQLVCVLFILTSLGYADGFITSIVATPNANATTSTITWTTCASGSTEVDYGLDTNYGQTYTDATPVTSHSALLTGIGSGLTFHYRVRTVDAQGVTAQSADGTFTKQTKTLSSIAVTPSSPSVAFGGTQQFLATGTYSDTTTAILTSTVTWGSGTPANVTINSAGLSSAVGVGTSLISATLGVSGSTTETVTKATPVFSNITGSQTITQGAASITVGGTLKAPTAIPSGGTVNISVSTASGNATVQSDGSFSTTINTSALTAGTFTITYSYSASTNFNAAANNTATSLTVNAASSGLSLDTTTCPSSVCPSVDSTTNTGSGVNTPTFSTGGTNRLLLAMISTTPVTNGAFVTGVTGCGLTWQRAAGASSTASAEIWRAFASSTCSSGHVTVTTGTTRDITVTVVAVVGVNTSGLNGSGAIGAANTVSISSGSLNVALTTTRNNSWVFAVGSNSSSASSVTVGTSQTLFHSFVDSANAHTFWSQRRNATTVTAGTSVTTNITSPTGQIQSMAAVEILPFSVSHSASLSWLFSGSNSTFSVYRKSAGCSATGTFGRIAQSLSATSYTDTAVTSGSTYCYQVTAVDKTTSAESLNSNSAQAVIP